MTYFIYIVIYNLFPNLFHLFPVPTIMVYHYSFIFLSFLLSGRGVCLRTCKTPSPYYHYIIITIIIIIIIYLFILRNDALSVCY